MAVGANIKFTGNRSRIRAIMAKKMGFKKTSLRTGMLTGRKRFCYKAGVPADATAADNPNALGDLCYDVTNDDIYRTVAYAANASTTDWTKIVD